MRLRASLYPILTAVFLLAVPPLHAQTVAPSAPVATAQSASTAVFDEAWRLVRDRFYDKALHGLDWEAIGDRYRPQYAAASDAAGRSAVINRMLAELGASHMGHYTPADPAYYQLADIFSYGLRQDLPKHFGSRNVSYPGIGIFTKEIDGKTFVSGVLDGFAGTRAGLLVGDEIVSANGAPFEPVELFRDKVGQEVTLTIRRAADVPTQDIAVRPERLQPGEMFLEAMTESARIIEAGGARIGYVHVWSYAGGEYQERLQELLGGKLKDADALVWDLRDGWGGAQPSYLDVFNARGPTMTMTDRGGDRDLINVKWRKPVALLANEGTRSGKEVLTDGFRRYGIGEVVGTRTAGALLAGRAWLLEDGTLLLLAVADVSVDGTRLEGIGVAPTIEVPFALPYAAGTDPQLDKAIDVLTRTTGG